MPILQMRKPSNLSGDALRWRAGAGGRPRWSNPTAHEMEPRGFHLCLGSALGVQTDGSRQGPQCLLGQIGFPELCQVPGTWGQGDGPDALWAFPGHSKQFLSSSQARQWLLPSGCDNNTLSSYLSSIPSEPALCYMPHIQGLYQSSQQPSHVLVSLCYE